MVNKLDRAWVFLGHGLHFLVALLALVTLVKDGMSWALAAFCFIYIVGMWLRPRGLWLLLVVGAWAVLLASAPTAAFIAFALFFLLIRFLPMRAAIPAVSAVTIIAIGALAYSKGWTVGGVIGPIMGAVVAIGLGIGFRMLRRETAAAERMRLAGEIHDTVAQGLVSIQMLLFSAERRLAEETLTDPQILQDLRLARNTAENNLEETRRIIAALQSPSLERGDLPFALQQIVDTTPMGEKLQFGVDGTIRTIPQKTQQEILRITQSLVSNVVKHSHATAARVTLTYQPETLTVDVVDNGRGMDVVSTQFSPVGLAAIQRKTRALGGTMTIESEPGHGCGISVEIPT
ncbi:sensor histidine kinase [Corynebacterium sp. sy039]|uniref:sensor histidine kinase n=1 Tax=Corynebacterium sp. sy039 TaxID=2599641 RepID=UPI0011B43B84|nr:sensor histidine kinase [Corynebacterium sp. sy039]QDZ43293.1 sensor histidine kinase [Corynebacterium sp. sy039]